VLISQETRLGSLYIAKTTDRRTGVTDSVATALLSNVRKQFIHAVLAEAYIVLIVLFIQNYVVKADQPGTILVPVVMLSFFVLSAAIMGYLFLGQPVLLSIDGKVNEAVRFFAGTVGFFALFLAVIIGVFLVN